MISFIDWSHWLILNWSVLNHWSIFLFLFIITILGWFLNLFGAFPTGSLVAKKSVSQLRLVGIFKFGTMLVKNFCYHLIFWNHFFRNYLLLPFYQNNFFSINVILDSVCTLPVNKSFTVFEDNLSVMPCVLILLKFLFSRSIKLPQRLHCLLYTFLSISHFVFKNLFQSCDLFMNSLFVFFIKGASFAQTYCCFMDTSLNSLIKCYFEKIKLKIVVFSSHLRYPILNISHKHFIRKMFLAAVCDNGWLLFFVEFFHYH